MDAQGLATRLANRCAADGEFRLMARYWDGSLRLDLGGEVLSFTVSAGQLRPAPDPVSVPAGRGAIGLSAPTEVWEKILAPVPPPFFNDIMPAQGAGLVREGDPETYWQYYPAVRRLVDLLREESAGHAAVR
jgi:hypothetical protein